MIYYRTKTYMISKYLIIEILSFVYNPVKIT